jgi:hypothetical protein
MMMTRVKDLAGSKQESSGIDTAERREEKGRVVWTRQGTSAGTRD